MEYQRCIVHQVRNTLKYAADKNKKEFAADLKTIYHVPFNEIGHSRMISVTEKCNEKLGSEWGSLIQYLNFQQM